MTLKVLIVKTTSMGDVLHTLPALTEARQHYPMIQFDWVVEEGFAQIPTWHFAVDKVIPVAIRRWRKSWFSKKTRAERKVFLTQLQVQQYDLVIDAQGLLKSALIARKAKGVKHGYDRKSIKEPIASFFYQVKHRVSKQLHAVDRIRLLFAASLKYKCDLNQLGDYGIARHFVSATPKINANEAQPYFIFLHATTRADKHWQESEWRALIALANKHHYQVKLPWGTQLEFERAQRLAQNHKNCMVLPKLSLFEVAQELASAEAVVSVDTGLSHLSAALDRLNLTLYGPTDPALIGGYGQNQHQIKAQDHKMASINANEVWERLNEIKK